VFPYQQWVLETIQDFSIVGGAHVLEVGGVPNHRGIAKNLVDSGASNIVQINIRNDLPVENCGAIQVYTNGC